MIIRKEKFIHDVNTALQEYIQENFDVYTAFDYTMVQRIAKDIDTGKVPAKPILHLSLTDKDEGVRQPISDGKEGRNNFFEYTIYSIINNKYKEGRSRKFVLDEITDELKDTFDSDGDSLPFRKVHFDAMTTELMGENPDGLYAIEHILKFVVMKEL